MVGKGFAKGFGERQGRSSLASHLRFACEIGAVLGVFSQIASSADAVLKNSVIGHSSSSLELSGSEISTSSPSSSLDSSSLVELSS
jgi:hypothetical protein